MTTHTLSQAISLRRQLSIEELLGFAPELAFATSQRPVLQDIRVATPVRRVSDSEYAFWSTFSFGCVQAVVVFGMIYLYFAR